MKQSLYIAAALLLAASSVDAQDTYLNDRMTNTSDVFGTARYMGMGGAMGALGGDISVISNNPAGIGLFRRGNISFTLGPVIQDNASQFDDSRATFLFDQMGFVANISNDDDGNRLNFAFNYQKKADYNQYFYGVQNLKGLSQADMFAWVASGMKEKVGGFKNPMYNALETLDEDVKRLFYNAGTYYKTDQRGDEGNYYRRTWGSLRGFDLNVSGSIEDRYFLGLTFGVDHVKYNGSGSYEEISKDPVESYVMYQDQEVRGYGFNFKVGGIVRPFEDNPFRIGLAIETPTWYELEHDSWAYLSFVDATNGNDIYYFEPFNLNEDYDLHDYNQNNFSNYLKYLVYSPWKFRLSMGSTVEDFLAWDVEYEYSLNQFTKMGYPEDEEEISMDKDRPMNDLTTDIMRGVHNIRAGLELRPLDGLAMRFGYNFYSKPYEDYARLDQSLKNCYAMYYNTNTEYLNLGATNILTCGLGYQGKHFYAECAYKYRMQKGDLYLFDDNFTTNNRSFINDNHELKEVHLDPTEVNLDRHQITLTLGYRF